MGSHPSCIVPLAEAAGAGDALVGGKAARLGSLIQAGFRVPRGFCITTSAYELFVSEAGLSGQIAMELGRKPLDAMRWEELWDAALRIRSAFLRAGIPEAIAGQIRRALADHVGDGAVAVRSSAPGEDSQQLSFAGLHESIVGVKGDRAVLDAVQTVWASLWSDAALLYRRELSLDPTMVLNGEIRVFKWPAARPLLTANRDPVRFEAALTESVSLPHGRGTNRADAICDLPPALSGGKASWLVLYDAPGADRKDGEHAVFGDLLRHN